MVSESTCVVLVEYALFLLGGAGMLLMHSEQSCVRFELDGKECVENGSLRFAVLYGVTLAASVGAWLVLMASSVIAALVPGRHAGAAEGVALAAMHWQCVVAATLVLTTLVVWQQPGNERRVLFAVLLRTGVGREEHEYLTKTYLMCVFVFLGFLVVFAIVLYVAISRTAGSTASMRLYSLAVSVLLLSIFVQRWLAAYRRRVCNSLSEFACMPPLVHIRATWFEPEYDTAWEAELVVGLLAACDIVGVKAHVIAARIRLLRPLCLLVFTGTRAASAVVLAMLIYWQLEYHIEEFYYTNVALLGASVVCSLLDIAAFALGAESGGAGQSEPAQSLDLGAPPARAPATAAFDITGGRKVLTMRRKRPEASATAPAMRHSKMA